MVDMWELKKRLRLFLEVFLRTVANGVGNKRDMVPISGVQVRGLFSHTDIDGLQDWTSAVEEMCKNPVSRISLQIRGDEEIGEKEAEISRSGAVAIT